MRLTQRQEDQDNRPGGGEMASPKHLAEQAALVAGRRASLEKWLAVSPSLNFGQWFRAGEMSAGEVTDTCGNFVGALKPDAWNQVGVDAWVAKIASQRVEEGWEE